MHWFGVTKHMAKNMGGNQTGTAITNKQIAGERTVSDTLQK